MISTDVETPCQDPRALWAFEASFDGRDKDAIEAAVAMCRTCPAQTECLRIAEGAKGCVGVWGGVMFVGKVYPPSGQCQRGHDTTGSNGRPRTDGRRTCRECERTAWERR